MARKSNALTISAPGALSLKVGKTTGRAGLAGVTRQTETWFLAVIDGVPAAVMAGNIWADADRGATKTASITNRHLGIRVKVALQHRYHPATRSR